MDEGGDGAEGVDLRRPPVEVPTALLALASAGFLASVRPLTWPATAGVAIVGGLMLARGLALSRAERLPAPAAMPRAAVRAWWVVLLAFIALEVTNDLLGSTWAHPTLSILLDPVTNSVPGRFVGVLVWVIFGDYLVRR